MKYWRHSAAVNVTGLGVLLLLIGSYFNNVAVHAQDAGTAAPSSVDNSTTTSPSTDNNATSSQSPPPTDPTPLLPPTAPLVVTVHVLDAGGVVVEWNDSQPGTFPLDHYVVQRSDNNFDFVEVANVTGTTSYTDASGLSGQWYRVIAVDNQSPANRSEPSSASQVPTSPMQDNNNIASNNPPSTTLQPESPPAPTQPTPAPNGQSTLPNAAGQPTPPAVSGATDMAPAIPADVAVLPPTTSPGNSSSASSPAPSATATPEAPTLGATGGTSTTLPEANVPVNVPVANGPVTPSPASGSPATTAPGLSTGAPAANPIISPSAGSDYLALATTPGDHNLPLPSTASVAVPADVELPPAKPIAPTNFTKTEEAKLQISVNNTATTTVTDKASLEEQVKQDDQRNTVQPPTQRTQLLDQYSDNRIVTLNNVVLGGQDQVVVPVLTRYNYEKQSILELSARLNDQSKKSAKDHCKLQSGILNTTLLALPVSERGMAIEAIARCAAIQQL